MRTFIERRREEERRRGAAIRVAAAFGMTFVGGGLFVLGGLPLRAGADGAETPPHEAVRVLGALASSENAVVELGRRLFFDPGASHSRSKSCASCHQPDHGWSDPLPRSRDDFGTTRRHSQTVLNLPSTASLHWDGEFDTLEALVHARTGTRRSGDGGYDGSVETAFDVTPVASSLAADGLYARAFAAAYGDPTPTRERLSSAVAEFVRTLASTRSAYDRYAGGEKSAMSAFAVRGLELFRGRAGCVQCHTMDGARPMFTDGRFHDTGVARFGSLVVVDCEQELELELDRGRALVTKSESDVGAFKTPSLRDVAQRAPYMHDASLESLEQVVRYYAIDCGQAWGPKLDPKISPFGAGRTPAEVDRDVADLVAFLGALTSETRPGLAPYAWSARVARTRLRLVWASGVPYRRAVELSPAGDVVPGVVADRKTIELVPDVDGWIEFTPFATTHAAIRLIGSSRPRSGDLVPDTCPEGTLTVLSASDFATLATVPEVAPNAHESTIRVRFR